MLHDNVLAPVPDWIISKLNPPPPNVAALPPIRAPRSVRDLNPLFQTVAFARAGERNHVTFWGACRMAEHVSKGHLPGITQSISLLKPQRAMACRGPKRIERRNLLLSTLEFKQCLILRLKPLMPQSKISARPHSPMKRSPCGSPSGTAQSALRRGVGAVADMGRHALAVRRNAARLRSGAPRSAARRRPSATSRRSRRVHRQRQDRRRRRAARQGRPAARRNRRSMGRRPLAAQHAGRRRRSADRRHATAPARRLHDQDHRRRAGRRHARSRLACLPRRMHRTATPS